MRIVLDARWIFEEISGVPSYTTELITHLGRIDSGNRYTLLFSDPALMERTDQQTGFSRTGMMEGRLFRHGIFSPKSQLALPRLLQKLDADLFHSPNYMIPILPLGAGISSRVKIVVTIHDVIPLKFPEFTPRSKKRKILPVYRGMMRRIGRLADAIITVSNASKTDLIEHLNLSADGIDSVKVVYNGVSDRYVPGQARPESVKKTILCVGRQDPYKNIETLIEAFAKIREAKSTDATLRIVGPDDPRYPEAKNRAKAHRLHESVRWEGHLDSNELLEAYQAADVFISPSRYEGFGLPVLEAMACGAPVVCTDAGSLPEIAGDAAIYVNPEDPEGMASALTRVLTDSREAERLREAGVRQAQAFSWDRTAQETLEVYASLGAGKA